MDLKGKDIDSIVITSIQVLFSFTHLKSMGIEACGICDTSRKGFPKDIAIESSSTCIRGDS